MLFEIGWIQIKSVDMDDLISILRLLIYLYWHLVCCCFFVEIMHIFEKNTEKYSNINLSSENWKYLKNYLHKTYYNKRKQMTNQIFCQLFAQTILHIRSKIYIQIEINLTTSNLMEFKINKFCFKQISSFLRTIGFKCRNLIKFVYLILYICHLLF